MRVRFYRKFFDVVESNEQLDLPPINYFLLINRLKDKLDCRCVYKNNIPIKLNYKNNKIDAINCYIKTNDDQFLNLVKEEIKQIEDELFLKMKTNPKFIDNELYSNSLIFKCDLNKYKIEDKLYKLSKLFKKYNTYSIIFAGYIFIEAFYQMDLMIIWDKKIVVHPMNIIRDHVNYFTIDLLELFSISINEK